MAPPDETLSRSDSEEDELVQTPRPHLFLVFDCDEPRAAVARVSLSSVDVVHIGRGSELRIERNNDDDGGGERACHISVPNRRASSKHVEIRKQIGRWSIDDLDSKNGTLVNGAEISSTHLNAGDIIEVGNAFFTYDLAPPSHDLVVDCTESHLAGTLTLDPILAGRLAALERIAPTDNAVLLQGETGTGKEVIARAVHTQSGRAGAFVAVNCGALPATLIEAQLFGHVKGAFTGAADAHDGLVRAAEGGTLFLDEIGDLPPPAQAALLRVLQEREVMPVGATAPVPVDFRLIAATHRDLEAMAEQGTFREDLLARITGFTCHLPGLRDRRVDLGLLVGTLLGDLTDAEASVSVPAARAMLAHTWPRNVRELGNTLRSALALADDSIALTHLPELIRAAKLTGRDDTAEDTERAQLIALLEKHKGNVSAVARELGKARMQLHRDAKRLGVEFASFRG